MDITRTIETSAPVDKVFAYLSDFTNTNEWDPGTVETTRQTGDGRVGSTYKNISSFLGSKSTLIYTVAALVPNEKLVLNGTNKTVDAVDTMTFTDTGSGTRVVYNADFTFKGVTAKILPLLTPVLKLAFKKLGDEAEAGMREALAQL